MNNKRIVIILSFLLFFVAVIILCSNIFTLKKVNIKLENVKTISASTQTQICTESCFKYNENIFIINKTKITNYLEQKYPNLMVKSIETIFPNQLVIHAEERVEVFYIKISQNSFASFDQTFKCINFYSTQPELTQITGINAEDAVVGQRLENKNVSIATQTYSSFYVSYYNEESFVNFIKRVEISNNNLILITRISGDIGLTISIENANQNLTQKVVYVLSAYNALSTDQKSHGTIELIENLDNSEKFIVTYHS